MKIVFFSFCILQSYFSFCQSTTSLNAPVDTVVYAKQLDDSISLQIITPSIMQYSSGVSYPVIFLFDKQNEINYQYNLETIDYLTSLSAMPPCIIVGVAFENSTRNKWTTPNISGGKADDLISFLFEDISLLLKTKFPVANFTTLIGHSRTAIFSSYAQSKTYPLVNAVVASSTANFDFGDENTKKQFELFLNEIEKSRSQYFLTFSSGTNFQLDYHEASVDSFANYLNDLQIPSKLTIMHVKEPVDHFVIPGLTVNRALANIFASYRKAAIYSLEVIQGQQQNDSVPWRQYLSFYEEQSAYYGFKIVPDLLFYNSIASSYANDYDGVFKDKSSVLALEVLLKCVESYPFDYSTYLWVSEIYFEQKKYTTAIEFAEKGIAVLTDDKVITADEKLEINDEINDFMESIHQEMKK